MSTLDQETIRTPIGDLLPDREGAPVSVVRVNPERSYVGTGALLERYLNGAGDSAWNEITGKIDYTYKALELMLGSLCEQTRFGEQVKRRLARGQKVLFKPNLVEPLCISPGTHAPAAGSYTCTEWGFVAALMRWFHDRLGVQYSQMCLGEAATAMTASAARLSRTAHGLRVTTESVLEGRSGNTYGGWGFYFARKYLAEHGSPAAGDDPMNGFEESVAGVFVPPGRAGNRLMVYDLNRVADEPQRGRAVRVSEGVTFKSITLHKAIVGGDPENPADRADYPGCILVNVPKLKVHAIALFTNVIKNLGIGLYPMHSRGGASSAWQYATPDGAVPGMKARIPHAVWKAELDPRSHLPLKDPAGSPLVTRTAGLPGTMTDIIRAVLDQDVFAIHVVDGIEARNLDHQGLIRNPHVKVPEGIAVAGLDPVATDLFCARYLFSNVGLAEAENAGLEDGHGLRFPQRVPLPTVEGTNIVERVGYDCPLARDTTFAYAERRGLGSRAYHVLGADVESGAPLVSVRGHLGSVQQGAFHDIFTTTLYCDVLKLPWDLQRTCLSYLQAVDQLCGSRLREALLSDYDETGRGSFGYEEFGRRGAIDALLHLAGDMVSHTGTQEHGELRAPFEFNARLLKLSAAGYNTAGDTLFEPFCRDLALVAAKELSQLPLEMPDPFLPSLTFGKGKWPSYQTAAFVRLGQALYGDGFPLEVRSPSLYGSAVYYADRTQSEGRYAAPVGLEPDPQGVQRYVADVTAGKRAAFDFAFFVPPGFGSVAGKKLPNVEETTDPARVFTASFSGGAESWPPPASAM